jgi:DNA end-binding protein Ku
MPIRSIGSVTVSFGLVSIPSKLYAATSSSTGISFNLLHKACGSRLKQQYVCANEGVIVERDDMVKGYEFAKDQYVRFSPEELKALEEKSTQTVEIAEFVPAEKIDPVYFDKPFYLAPDKGGEKAYRLLAEAMLRTGRSALARYAARGKQYLVLLRPSGGGLVMQQLLYADEVRSMSEVPIPQNEVKDVELQLAMQLVGQISSESFHPENYHDDVKARIEEAIARKVEGQEVTATPAESGTAQIIDIMEALKASLAKKPAAAVAPEPASSAAPAPPAVERKPAKRAPRRDADADAATSKSK